MNIQLNGDNLRVTIEFEPEQVIGQAVIQSAYIVRTQYVGVVNVDRREMYGISVGKNLKLADRLVKAINAGKVFTPARFGTDVNGRTYVVTTCNVSGRHLNADLKKLGF